MSAPDGGRKAKRTGSATVATRSRNWKAIRAKFLASPLSTRDFAESEGIPYGTLAKRAAADGWEAAREAHRAKVAAGVEERNAEGQIEAEAEINRIAHVAAMKLARKMLGMVDGIDEPGAAKACAQGLAEAFALARKAANLPAEPQPSVAQSQVTVIVRGVDEHGTEFEQPADAAPDAGVGSSGLPAHPHPGEVPPL